MGNQPSFYTDSHIPYAVVKQLRENGVDVLRCQDVGLDDASDEEHLIFATEQGRIVITCDYDFPYLHYRWLELDKHHAGIVYCRAPELCTISTIIENVMLIYEDPDGRSQLQDELWRVQK